MTKDDNSNKIDLAQLQNININELLDTINIKIFQNHLDNIVFKELDPRFLSQHVRFETIKIFEILQLIFKENIRVQEELIGELNNSVSNYESEKEAINRKCRHIKEIKKSNLNSQSKIKRKQKEVCIVESLLQNVKDNQQTKRLESDRLYHQQNNNSTIHLYFVINDSLHPKEDDQLVVEMNEKRDQQIITIVALLQCKLDLIYKQQRGVNHTASGSTFVCKLMLRDKVVYDSSDIHRQAFDSRVTLSQIGVQDMDTITVTVEIPHTVAVIDEETVARQALHQQQQQHMELMSQRMDRVLTSQQDTMISIASEMRHGWETAMQSITALQTQHFQTEDAATTTMAKSSTAAVEAISQLRQEQESKARAETDRLARLECTIRDQLSSQFKEYDGRLHDALTQQSMQQRARVEELEINGENMTSAIKLSQSHIEKLDAELRSTRESIDDLRGSMTSHFSDLKSFQGDLQCNINDALMRLNERSTSTRRTSDQMIGTDPIIVEPIEILEEPPVPVVIEELEEAIFDHTPEIEPTNEPIIVPDVEITLQYFQTDSNTIRDQGPFETVIILTKFSLLSEELIFHMRREIAMQIRVPLAHTLLWWRGHPVRVWSDLVHVPSLEPETDAFTVNDAKERAGEGALKYTVATPAPMRDAQLDFLVSQYKSLLQAKSSNEVMDTSKQASTNRFMNDTMSSTSFFNRSLSPARVGKYYDVVEEGLIEGKSEDYNNRSIPRSRIVNAFEDLAGEFAQTEYLERLSETELREKVREY